MLRLKHEASVSILSKINNSMKNRNRFNEIWNTWFEICNVHRWVFT